MKIMKLYRALYWVVLICALLWGLYSGNRFSWLLFLLLLFVLLSALALDLWTIFSFSYLQKLDSQEGEKGQSVGLSLSIYNDKPFPFTHMKVRVETPDPEESRMLEIDLPPKEHCSFAFSLSMPRRGEYQVGMTKLSVQDVFGLLPMRMDLRLLPYYRQQPLLVLPRVRALSLPGGGDLAGSAGGTAVSASGQDEFSHLTSWQPGDRFSAVHWKASARTGTLLTRRYEDPAKENCLIFLDRAELSDTDSDLIAECAATLAHAHLARGDGVRLACSEHNAKQPPAALGLGDLTAVRQWLATVPFHELKSDVEALADTLCSEAFGRVYVLGGALSESIYKFLSEQADPLSCYYFQAKPLELRVGNGAELHIASFYQRDLEEFLREQLLEP